MKKRFLRFSTYLFSSLLLTLPLALQAKECTHLTATGNSEYSPYLWRNSESNDKLDGAISLVIKELSKRLERDIKLKHIGTWSRALEEVKAGRVDIIAGAFYTDSRNEWMDYTRPAFMNTTSVVWKSTASDFNYREKSDLNGGLGVTVINNSFGQSFDDYAKKNLKIEQVASLEQAFKMLALKRVDYGLYEKNPGLAYASKMNLGQDIEPLSPPVSSEGLYLTISKKSACNTNKLKDELTKLLQEMSTDGVMKNALKVGLESWERLNAQSVK